MKKQFLFFLFLSFTFIPEISQANSSSYYDGDGVTVFPIENENVVMQKEVIRIKSSSEDDMRWKADCAFIFYNKSNEEQLVTMGYPDWINNMFEPDMLNSKAQKEYWQVFESLPKEQQESYKQLFQLGHGSDEIYFTGYKQGKLPYVPEGWNLKDLRVIIAGKEIKTKHKPLNIEININKKFEDKFTTGAYSPPGAFIWKVDFKPNEIKTINVSFSFKGLSDASSEQELSYILKTGALWAGNIGVADIYWDITGHKLKSASPAGYSFKKNIFHWHFENFEPSEDINLFVSIVN